MNFESIAFCEQLLSNLNAAGYRTATPIQGQAIPVVLQGRDLIGCAQTGTGKTAAFALPVLQRLIASRPAPLKSTHPRIDGQRPIRSLVLTPTRELAAQIGNSLTTYGKHSGIRHAVIYGGVSQFPQVRAIRSGVDLVIATPGRLLDLMKQGVMKLASIEILVLDEADHMLDMGFIHDLKKIVSHLPANRQTLMFSATMPPQIRELASQWLKQPVEVHAAPVASTPERVTQRVCFVDQKQKMRTLVRFLSSTSRARTLVFSRTKHGADKIVRQLEEGGIRAVAIHGNKSQARRTSAMREFSSHQPPVLVATDLAARGLDFSNVSHVINFDLPDVAETYVHRIGRTARAGATGAALSFCARDEHQQLRMIERLTGRAIPVVKLPGFTDERQTSRPKDESKSKNRCLQHPSRFGLRG